MPGSWEYSGGIARYTSPRLIGSGAEKKQSGVAWHNRQPPGVLAKSKPRLDTIVAAGFSAADSDGGASGVLIAADVAGSALPDSTELGLADVAAAVAAAVADWCPMSHRC